MAETPTDLTHELLRQIRAELGVFRSDMERRFELVNYRYGALETDMLEVKRKMRGMSYMLATFTGRLEVVETRVDRLALR